MKEKNNNKAIKNKEKNEKEQTGLGVFSAC